MQNNLDTIYRRLYRAFGPQRWWPGDTAFEVMVGAILTQNTNWANVERAIANLKKSGTFSCPRLYRLSPRKLAKLIRPAGYYNLKAKRLKNFFKFYLLRYQGSHKKMSGAGILRLREELLSVNGVGQETADSILLYALGKPVFVVDAYTKRIFSRHGFIPEGASYEEVQRFFMQNLRNKVQLFNEYHALIVRLGKDFCLKSKPKCGLCPLKNLRSAKRLPSI